MRNVLVVDCLLAALWLTIALVDAAAAAGRNASFGGSFVGGDREYRQDLKVTRRADGGYDVSATVGTPGCSGSVDAQGALEGAVLKARSKAESGETCVLTLASVKGGVKLSGVGCNYFHGPSCEFDGRYRRKR